MKSTNFTDKYDLYRCAVTNLISDHGDCTQAEDCYKANYLNIKQLKEIGVDERDIEILTLMIKEIKRKKLI